MPYQISPGMSQTSEECMNFHSFIGIAQSHVAIIGYSWWLNMTISDRVPRMNQVEFGRVLIGLKVSTLATTLNGKGLP